MNSIFLGVLAIYASPSVPLGIGWWKLLQTRSEGNSMSWLVPAGATSSLVWLLMGSVFPNLWGAYYGHLRFAIIDGNFIAMLLAAIAAFSARPRLQIWVGGASLMLAFIWAFVASIKATL